MPRTSGSRRCWPSCRRVDGRRCQPRRMMMRVGPVGVVAAPPLIGSKPTARTAPSAAVVVGAHLQQHVRGAAPARPRRAARSSSRRRDARALRVRAHGDRLHVGVRRQREGARVADDLVAVEGDDVVPASAGRAPARTARRPRRRRGTGRPRCPAPAATCHQRIGCERDGRIAADRHARRDDAGRAASAAAASRRRAPSTSQRRRRRGRRAGLRRGLDRRRPASRTDARRPTQRRAGSPPGRLVVARRHRAELAGVRRARRARPTTRIGAPGRSLAGAADERPLQSRAVGRRTAPSRPPCGARPVRRRGHPARERRPARRARRRRASRSPCTGPPRPRPRPAPSRCPPAGRCTAPGPRRRRSRRRRARRPASGQHVAAASGRSTSACRRGVEVAAPRRRRPRRRRWRRR